MLPVICSPLRCRWQGPAEPQRAHLPHAGALLQLLARQEAAARQLAAGEGGGQHGVANWAGGRCSRGCSVQSAGFRLAEVLTSCGEGLPEQPGAMGTRRCGWSVPSWRDGGMGGPGSVTSSSQHAACNAQHTTRLVGAADGPPPPTACRRPVPPLQRAHGRAQDLMGSIATCARSLARLLGQCWSYAIWQQCRGGDRTLMEHDADERGAEGHGGGRRGRQGCIPASMSLDGMIPFHIL